MKIREEREGGIVVLEPEGRIDSTTAPLLDDRLTAILAARGARLVLDFRYLDYISSAGFRALLLGAKLAETSGSAVVLCGVTGKVRQLFELAGFLDLIPLYASRDEGVASFR